MAKVTILGGAVVVTSEFKFDEIKMVEKYRPKELVLMGGEDNKDEVFRIGTTVGNGSICEYGASFGRRTRGEEEKAMITFTIENIENLKEYITDEFGSAIMNLNKIEEKIPDVIEEIKREREKVMSGITVVQ